MSFYEKIRGTAEALFQLGKSGPQLKNNSSVVEHRNSADAAFVIARAADPAGSDDLVTKRYGDAHYGASNVGNALVDFGALYTSEATTIVTGQTGILTTSSVEAWIAPAVTADHSADEHMLEDFMVYARDLVAGVGFTIYIVVNGPYGVYGKYNVDWRWA